MGLLNSVRISASALSAQRIRMDVTANNVANMESTSGPDAGPFRRQMVSFRALPNGTSPFQALFSRQQGAELPTRGVGVERLLTDTSPGRRVHDPTHPAADDEGFIEMPNVNLVVEMTDMVSSTRAYEANVTVLNAAKSMAMRALEIARR